MNPNMRHASKPFRVEVSNPETHRDVAVRRKSGQLAQGRPLSGTGWDSARRVAVPLRGQLRV